MHAHAEDDFIDLLSVDLLVPWYLMTSYAYYECDESIITDRAFDELAQRLDKEWERASQHWHSHLIDRKALKSGGSYLVGKFPLRVKHAAAQLFGAPLFSRQ